ncbi:MAG: SH3 domain-containing protein [Pseudomonadales bacterium]
MVRPGSRIRFIARQGDWYKVITDRGEGYVQSDYALEQ